MLMQQQYTVACNRAQLTRTRVAAVKSRKPACMHEQPQVVGSKPASQGRRLLQRQAIEEAASTFSLGSVTLEQLAADLNSVEDAQGKVKLLLGYAKTLPPFSAEDRNPNNRVMGCASQVWLTARLDDSGCVQLAADSDSAVSKGLAAILVNSLSGMTAQQLLELDASVLSVLPLGPSVLTAGRTNSLYNMMETIRKRVRLLTDDRLPTFPSLLLTADSIEAQGSFAEAQAQYLQPQPAQVAELAELLQSKKIGVVAHFYMDPQVQGVLTSAAQSWPHIQISDSLVMADRAVKMAEAGCTTIAVLGVDFMSENVRAILDEAGHTDVKVYRMDSASIGCSLAEAAESPQYDQYLTEAHGTPRSLHVVYINTSLRTKAYSDSIVPTITCTSSNVVQTILTAYAQVPECTVWYGPDTYMGANVAKLFSMLSQLPDSEVQQLHPAHTQETIKQILPRLRYFQDGTCIVHHMFGGETCEIVKRAYSDAYLTAHFEVPGEMFSLAMEARQRGRGVVGSTQNILDFITAKVKEAIENPFPERLQFVLGTESGMITSIVRAVQSLLTDANRKDIEVEVVFPVSPEAITTEEQVHIAGPVQATTTGTVTLPGGLPVVPGAASGEGCSIEGGCASCPYMKMNSLDALLQVCRRVGTAGESLLAGYEPKPYNEKINGKSVAQVLLVSCAVVLSDKPYGEKINGKSVAQAGCVPILHMRDFQRDKKFSQRLVDDIMTRNSS